LTNIRPLRKLVFDGLTAEAEVDVNQSANERSGFTRGQELRSFLFLTIVMAPVVAVAVVGGYGFVVWMSQLVGGPPTGP